jgi:pilus assembly protein Flp/PilA
MLRKTVKAFAKCHSGATAMEYALIAGFISLAIIGGATAIGVEASAIFGDSAKGLQKRPAVT